MDQGCFSNGYLDHLIELGPIPFVNNAHCQITSKTVAGYRLPVTVSVPVEDPHQSYVTSPRTAYGRYSQEELDLIGQIPGKGIMKAVIGLADKGLKNAGIDHAVSLNNWLLSTNLYPKWHGDELKLITAELVEEYPKAFLIARSLNFSHHRELLECFVAQGWKLLPARRIWLVEPDDKVSHNRKIDRKLLAHTNLARLPGEKFKEADFERAADLYQELYQKKYSYLNPGFTAKFMMIGHQTGMMKLEGLLDDEGQMIGVVGTIHQNGIMTTPVVGYDLSVGHDLKLYRLLMAIAFEHMEEQGVRYNVSAGAGSFKRLRGASPVIEYTACYEKHLSFMRRITMASLRGFLTHFGIPIMERFDL